jgi:hypothetical protein
MGGVELKLGKLRFGEVVLICNFKSATSACEVVRASVYPVQQYGRCTTFSARFDALFQVGGVPVAPEDTNPSHNSRKR